MKTGLSIRFYLAILVVSRVFYIHITLIADTLLNIFCLVVLTFLSVYGIFMREHLFIDFLFMRAKLPSFLCLQKIVVYVNLKFKPSAFSNLICVLFTSYSQEYLIVFVLLQVTIPLHFLVLKRKNALCSQVDICSQFRPLNGVL